MSKKKNIPGESESRSQSPRYPYPEENKTSVGVTVTKLLRFPVGCGDEIGWGANGLHGERNTVDLNRFTGQI